MIFIFYYFVILKYNYFFIKIITTLVFIIFNIFLLIIFLKNPGIPGREYYRKNFKINSMEKKNYRKCSKCNIIIPKQFKVVHCQKCEICIRKHDHHCPWTGKCIGENNLYFFYNFVCALLCYFCFLFVSVITCFFYVFSK